MRNRKGDNCCSKGVRCTGKLLREARWNRASVIVHVTVVILQILIMAIIVLINFVIIASVALSVLVFSIAFKLIGIFHIPMKCQPIFRRFR